jgi:K+-sensing histidine kinase KdpD
MATKSKKIIYFIYWILLFYVLAALIWWYIALSQQNQQMTAYKISRLSQSESRYHLMVQQLNIDKEKKNKQYFGEGAIFLLFISAGAYFLFRTLNKQIKQTEQQQNFMVAVTHELKTPIAVTQLNLETLLKRKLDEQQFQKLLQNTIQESNRMNALCNNLLLSSQMEGDGYQITLEKIHLQPILEVWLKEVMSRFPERSFEVEFSESNAWVLADQFLLQMAVNNLLDNAVKYSPKNTAIKIGLTSNNQHAFISIADLGSGVDASFKKKIFEKHYRIGSEATKKSKGTGLGLYLVKRIMLAHKGKVYVEDNKPNGAAFILQLNNIN